MNWKKILKAVVNALALMVVSFAGVYAYFFLRIVLLAQPGYTLEQLLIGSASDALLDAYKMWISLSLAAWFAAIFLAFVKWLFGYW